MPEILISLLSKFPVFRFMVLYPSTCKIHNEQNNIHQEIEKISEVHDLTSVPGQVQTSYNQYKHEVLSDDGTK